MEQPQDGERIPPADPTSGITEKILASIQPFAISRGAIGCLAAKSKKYQWLLKDLRALQQAPYPSPGEIQRQWRETVQTYAKYLRMRYEKEWRAEQLIIRRANLRRCLIELQEAEESRMIHAIKTKLGPKFLHRAPPVKLSTSTKSRLHSGRRAGTKKSLASPSESASPA